MKKLLSHPVGFVAANIIIFVLLRYINILIIFLNGIGPGETYSIFDYLPALLIQCLVVAYLYFRSVRKNKKSGLIKYLLTIFILFILFFARHFDLIPQSILPI